MQAQVNSPRYNGRMIIFYKQEMDVVWKMFGKYFLSTKYFVNIKGAAFSNDYIKGTAFLVILFRKIICGAF